MKYYQTVTVTSKPRCWNEEVLYQGYDLEAAKKACEADNDHHKRCRSKWYKTEIRVFELEKPLEEMTIFEQDRALSAWDYYEEEKITDQPFFVQA